MKPVGFPIGFYPQFQYEKLFTAQNKTEFGASLFFFGKIDDFKDTLDFDPVFLRF